ncbi:MAG: hypothetical protein Q9162_001356 [Coniocarpon cinnabarinum]
MDRKDVSSHEIEEKGATKKTRDGVVLVPQPSDDPRDPLVSSAIAGLMAGPILLAPLAHVVGISSCVFWSLIAMAMFGIWSAEMTSSDDYDAFVISRLFGGLVGSVPQILGNGIIVNIFFLHERGRAFAIYSTFFTIGKST